MGSAHDKILEMVMGNDEISWQSIIYNLVKSEEMDPWNINVSLLAKKYIDTIRKLKELDLRISGKVVLAAAILLKIKSSRLVGEDLSQLDRLFASTEEEIEEDLENFEEILGQNVSDEDRPALIPRTPQPRKRKVSIYDLVDALEKALEVKHRRVLHSMPPTNIRIPEKRKDITEIIRDVYGKIKSFFLKNKKNIVLFSSLVPSDSKEAKIYTFIPLLHLTNQRKIDIFQEQHFGDIEIMMKAKKAVDKELAEEPA